MAEWLRTLIFSTLKSLHHLTAVGSSQAQVPCETSQVMLAGGQVFFFLQISRFIDSAQSE